MNATETARGPAIRAVQLTTLAEQLFDHEQDTPASPAPLPACPQTGCSTAQTSPDTVITALVRAHTPASRTVDQALAEGIEPKAVWRAVCEAFDIPERSR